MLLNVRSGNTCVKMGRIRAETWTPEKTELSTYPCNGGVMQLEKSDISYEYSDQVYLDMG